MKERGVAEQRQGFHHGAAGAEDFVALIGNDNPWTAAMRHVIDDLIRQIVHVDDRFADARIRELVEYMIEQGLAGHRDHGLRHPLRQRPHTQAETCGEHHGFGRFDGHP